VVAFGVGTEPAGLIFVIKVVWLILPVIGFVDVILCSIITSIGFHLFGLLEVVLALVDHLKFEIIVFLYLQILVILGILTLNSFSLFLFDTTGIM